MYQIPLEQIAEAMAVAYAKQLSGEPQKVPVRFGRQQSIMEIARKIAKGLPPDRSKWLLDYVKGEPFYYIEAWTDKKETDKSLHRANLLETFEHEGFKWALHEPYIPGDGGYYKVAEYHSSRAIGDIDTPSVEEAKKLITKKMEGVGYERAKVITEAQSQNVINR